MHPHHKRTMGAHPLIAAELMTGCISKVTKILQNCGNGGVQNFGSQFKKRRFAPRVFLPVSNLKPMEDAT